MRRLAFVLLLFTACGYGQIAINGGVSISGSVAVGDPSGTPTAATPTASPAAGTYSSAQSVTLTTSTGGATICYTTDNTTPTASAGTCTHGTTYTTAISVSSSLTINAIASESGYTNSSMLSATYTITGTGSPTFSASPTSISEGNILTNTTAYFQLVTVTNTGTANLTFSAIGFTGTNASDFAITTGFSPSVNPVGGNTLPECSTGTPLTPSASCIVPIDFVPGANGSRSASLSFTDNASGSPHTVAITGTGTAASGTVLPACGSMLSANTTYYANSDITCNDAAYGLNGQNIVVNLNGHTVTCGQSPSNTLTGRPCFYNAASYANPFNLSSCSISGGSSQCYNGVTPTTNNGGSEEIENGTIVVAAGATSSATMQYGSAAIFANESGNSGSGQGWKIHDLTITIPKNCTSCWAYSSWPGDYGTGPGDKIWKVNVTDNSGFVSNRCSYEGTAFNLSYYSSTSNPGAIFYENTVDHTPQDGLAIATNQSTVFGNTLKVGNPTGTSAGTSATCSGVGTSANGTMSANDFGIEVTAASNSAIVNNNVNNYQGRGIDISAPNGNMTNTYAAGNTETTTDLTNYVEYQGCQDGGSYADRMKLFGYSNATNLSFQNEALTVTAKACNQVAYSQSDNSSTTNFDSGITATALLASGHGVVNAIAFQDATLEDGNTFPYFSTGMVVSGDTMDVAFGNAYAAFGGPWTCVNCTFVKPATATIGVCGPPGGSTPESSWVVFSACYPGVSSGTLGPLYIVNPTLMGGATESSNDFALGSSVMANGTIASYYIQYQYQVTVTGAVSGLPISGATVTATDSHSTVECTATTNSSGVATCNGYTANGAANSYLNKTEYSFTAPSAPVTTTFNPYNFSITKSGCTTNNYSESITANTSDTKTLGGC